MGAQRRPVSIGYSVVHLVTPNESSWQLALPWERRTPHPFGTKARLAKEAQHWRHRDRKGVGRFASLGVTSGNHEVGRKWEGAIWRWLLGRFFLCLRRMSFWLQFDLSLV